MSKKPNNIIATMYATSRTRTVVYDRESEMFWQYKGKVWEPFRKHDMEDNVANFCDKGNYDGNFTQATYRDIAEQCRRKVKHVDELEDKYLSFDDCLLDPETFETFPHPIPPSELSKIILGMPESEREQANKEHEDDYLERTATIHVPHDYADLHNCKMPMFREYLNDTCLIDGEVNQGMWEQLQEWAGYAITHESDHRALITYGDGGTGKSVYLDIIRNMISKPRTLSIGLNDLTKKDFMLPALVGKRAIVKDEEHASSNDIAKLKSIISGDPIDTRRLYGEPFTLYPKVKMYFGSQRFPRLDGFDNSIKRRFMVIPFFNIVPDNRKVRGLSRKIIKNGELPAIIFWALEGLRRLKDNNFVFTETKHSISSMDEFKAQSSSVAEYLMDYWKIDDGSKASLNDIYSKYCEWCKETNRKPVSNNRFSRDASSVIGKSKSVRVGGKIVKGYNVRMKGDVQIKF